MSNSLLQWTFFAATLLLAMSLPGPGVLATISKSLRFGSSKTTWFILGAALGDLTFLWIALLGLTSVLTTNLFWFSALTFCLGLYFSATGIFVFIRRKEDANKPSSLKPIRSTYSGQLFLEGYLLTISNPKVAIFYLGLLPSLLNVASMSRGDYVLVSFITPLLLFIVLSFYALVADRAQGFLTEKSAQKYLESFSAIIMISIGLLLIFKSGVIAMLI